jgi:choline-sulfatase
MQQRPNILHLFTDQQRFDTIAALGNPFIRTPNLDRLVREGSVFSRAYSPSPECVPARASMITGWYPGRTRCYSNEQAMPGEDTPTLMSGLRDAGYRTHGIGKCHFTPDSYALRGFETRASQEELPADRSRDDYAKWLMETGREWVLEPHGVRGEMYYVPQPSVISEEAHPTRWVADRAVEFIREQQDSERPWYLYTSFIHPHPPFAPPIPWHKLYRAPDMPLPLMPENLDDLLCFINHFQNRYKYRDRGLDVNLIRCLRAYYHACITFIDAQIGNIIAVLEASGQWDNTLVLFGSDHGEYLGDYGCFGKRGFHDVAARIPLIVRWPDGALAGTRCERPASLVDLAPTFLEAAGVPFSERDFDGVSLRGLAAGESGRECVFSQYNCRENGLYMAVNEKSKYAYSAPDGREYCFDFESDPSECRNLAGDPNVQKSFEAMRGNCLDWVAESRQPGALSENGDWCEYPVRKMPTDPDALLIFQDPSWWDGQLPA